MKNKLKPILLILLLNVCAASVFSQQSNLKMQFSVTDDDGKFVSGLKSADIAITQGEKTAAVTTFEEKNDQPLEVVLMIDASASQERIIPVEKIMAEIIVNSILKAGKDKVAVVKLTGTAAFTQPLTKNFQAAKEEIRRMEFEPPSGYIGGGIIAGTAAGIGKNQRVKGSTSIWESINSVIENFPDENKNNSRRVIFLLSDGVNTDGDAKLREAVEASVKNRVPIYAIGIGDSNYDGVDKKTLEKLTGQSGGVLIIPKKKVEEFQIQIKQIESSLRSFYEAILLSATTGRKNSRQESEVQITNPELKKRNLQIIYPKRFYALN